jgi:ABC-2 type transport system ATP-binding protein
VVLGPAQAVRPARAVEDVSLQVGRGEVVGLLGPNGAGKTTVIKMLLGLVQPDAGEVMLLGRPAPIRPRAPAWATCPSSSATSRG